MYSDLLISIRALPLSIKKQRWWSAGSHLCRSGGHGEADEVRIYQPAQPLHHMPKRRQHCPTGKPPAVFGHQELCSRQPLVSIILK